MRSATRAFAAILALLLIACAAAAAPEDAVVKVPSHGGSAVVIQTGPGYTYLLSAGHMFDSPETRRRRIVIDAPMPERVNVGQGVGIEVLAVSPAEERDLALLLMHAGPMPYVCPVPNAAEYRISGDLISAGYDEMKPRTVRPAQIIAVEDPWIYTHQKPWHGRSGGGLIDRQTGMLIGIVSSYEAEPGAAPGQVGNRGKYASRRSILAFLQGATGAGQSRQLARPRIQPQSQPFFGAAPSRGAPPCPM